MTKNFYFYSTVKLGVYISLQINSPFPNGLTMFMKSVQYVVRNYIKKLESARIL